MKHYACINDYADETSAGFTNTGRVLVFENRASRDNYVEQSDSMGTLAIKKTQIGEYIDRPEPFSGQSWQIEKSDDDEIDGLLGEVICDYRYQGMDSSRFF